MKNLIGLLVIGVSLGLAAGKTEGETKTDEEAKTSKNVGEIERDGKKYLLEILEKEKKMTVTDPGGTVVTISVIKSGNYNVRLPNNWGSWQTSLNNAMDAAIRLCEQAQDQRTPEKAYEEMVEYVRKKDNRKKDK